MSLAISDILRVTCIVRVFTGKKDCRQTNDHALILCGTDVRDESVWFVITFAHVQVYMNHTMSQKVKVPEQAFCVVGTKQVSELFLVHAAELSALDVVVPGHFHVPEFEFIAGPLQPLLYVPLRPGLGIYGGNG